MLGAGFLELEVQLPLSWCWELNLGPVEEQQPHLSLLSNLSNLQLLFVF